MSRDEEMDFLEASYVTGYASLAAFIAKEPDHSTAIYHRFDELSARNLLYMQSELSELKAKQAEFDQDDLRLWKQDVKGIEVQKRASDWKVLEDEARSGNPKAQERMQLIFDIRSKLKEYRKMMQ
jgi:hypothetical protein